MAGVALSVLPQSGVGAITRDWSDCADGAGVGKREDVGVAVALSDCALHPATKTSAAIIKLTVT
jgi:hypothetical protein